MARKPAFDIPTIKSAASGRWAEILSQLARVPLDTLDGHHHPCPKCGGTDRFRFTNVDQGGSAICNHCLTAKNGDGFSVLQWLTGDDFPAALARVADYLGIKPTTPSKPKADPLEHVTPQPWNDTLASLWCRSKPPITPAAVQAFNGRIARWDQYGGFSVIALPIWGPKLDQAAPISLMLWNLSAGQGLPAFNGKGKPLAWKKMRNTGGNSGLIVQGPLPLPDFSDLTIWKTEGPGDALALWSMIPDVNRSAHFIFCNSSGAKECPPWIVAMFSGCTVNVVHDADQPGESGATKWTTHLAQVAVDVRHVRLPYKIAETSGKDLRDYFNDGHTFADLLAFAAARPPIAQGAAPDPIPNEADDDPHRLARIYLDRYGSHPDHDLHTLHFLCGEWLWWDGTRYYIRNHREQKAKINLAVKEEFDRIHAADLLALSREAEKEPVVAKVTSNVVNNAIAAIEARTVLDGKTEMPSWLTGSQPDQLPIVALKNGLLRLDKLLADKDDFLRPHSPRWLSTVFLSYSFDLSANATTFKDAITYNLEGDQDRIAILQEFAGYCLGGILSKELRFQKFLMLEGNAENGKSVYCAAVQAMLGSDSVSNVPLEIFGERFALTATLGKLANIVADCGEIDKVAEGHLKSFTSGDSMFFDRKGLPPLNCKPTAKLIVAVNTRPRLSDRSDGVWRRLLLVPFQIKIPESKRVLGMDDPDWWVRSGELPGIFNWAVAGLHRLIQNRQFTTSQISVAATESYRKETNSARAFASLSCEECPGGRIATEEIYESYRKWCTKHGYKPAAESTFGKAVLGKFPNARKRRIGARGSRFHVYEEITLQPEL